MFFVIKKSQILLAVLLAAALSIAVFFSFATRDRNIPVCRIFLKELGYSFEKTPCDMVEISIPEGFGKVYGAYNILQQKAGFDLTPLRGKTVLRYSFRLKNDEYTLANILISDGKICGGDVLNPSLSGKMAPLIPKEKE